jgi:choice-of-anchor B domain-containing protein
MSNQPHATTASKRALDASSRRPRRVAWGVALLLLLTGSALRSHDDSLPGNGQVPLHARDAMRAFAADHHHNEQLSALAVTTCSGGFAGSYPCDNVDLMAFLPHAQIGGGNGNDIWGWTDPVYGREYALVGQTNGTSVVDITDPLEPVYMGRLPARGSNSSWRDIKVYKDHAFIGSEAVGSGVQVMDLTQLRNVTNPPVTLVEAAHYTTNLSTSHNVVINEDSGYAYMVGASNCSGGLVFLDIRDPRSPTHAGCFSADGYTHDAQCVNYVGPDIEHRGKEICLAFNEDTLTIVDVTNKSAPVQLSRTTYPNARYTHQGWFTDDQAYALSDDELDEYYRYVGNTRTLIWDLRNLDAPLQFAAYSNPNTTAIDHNQYVRGDYVYQANYVAGLRILDISGIAAGELNEVAFFDIHPASDGSDNNDFNGAWSVYPYFPSGNVVVNGIEQGLYILRPNLGLPNDAPVVTIVEPADGGPDLAGTVTVRLKVTDTEDPDDSLEVAWSVDSGAWQPAEWDDLEQQYTATWDTANVGNGPHMLTARATDSGLRTGVGTRAVTTFNGEPAFVINGLDVIVLGGNGNRNRGQAILQVTGPGGAVAGVAISGNFAGDWSGARSGSTDEFGVLSLTTPPVKGLGFVDFCVDAASKDGWAWDEDLSLTYGDSNGGSGSCAGGATTGTLQVTVFDTSEVEINDALVSIDTGQSSNSGEFGMYEFAGVPVGDRTVSVTASGYESASADAVVLEDSITQVPFVLTASASGGPGSIKGTVFAESGGKISEATVQVQGGTSSLTNKGGRYTIQNVPEGTQTVTASGPGLLPQEREVVVIAGGTVTLDFVLGPE